MANNTLASSILLSVLLCVFVGLCGAQEGGGGGTNKDAAGLFNAVTGGGLKCVEKLKPCQAYLADHSGSPPPECCGPLKEVMDGDTPCLCSLFGNQLLMRSMNMTQEKTLGLAKACGDEADPSLCKNASPQGSPSNADGESAPDSSSSSSDSGESAPAGNSGNVASPIGVYLLVLSFFSLMM